MSVNNSSRHPLWDCIVIGAGMSGLAASSRLAKAGHRVLVLEARDRIGGRIHTYREGLPCPVDLGASFVHGVDGNPLTELAHKYQLRLHNRFEDASVGFTPDGKLIPEEMAERITGNVFTTFFDKAREASRSELSSFNHSLADYLFSPSSPLYDGLESETEKDYATQVAQVLDGWTGASLEQISFRFWGFEREFDGYDAVVANGYTDILVPLQDEVTRGGGEVRLGEKVNSIIYDEDEGTVAVNTTFGTFKAKACICTIPLGVLKQDPPKFEPPLPSRRLHSINACGSGLLNKIVISYPSLWWPQDAGVINILQKGVSPAHSVPDILAQRALFIISYQPITNQPVLVVFSGGPAGAALESMSDVEAGKWIHGALKRCLLGLPGAPTSAPEPTKCIVTRWLADPLARGSYSYIPAASEEKREGEIPASPLDMVELSRPLWEGRLGFAGEHTEMDHYASVHGALLSGWREGDRVKAALEGSWASLRRELP